METRVSGKEGWMGEYSGKEKEGNWEDEDDDDNEDENEDEDEDDARDVRRRGREELGRGGGEEEGWMEKEAVQWTK